MVIRLEQIDKRYKTLRRTREVFSGLNLTIDDGKFTLLKGESGSGKSTLINLLLGFTPADSGKVYYEDTEFTGLDESSKAAFRRENIGVVTQDSSLISYLTVDENIVLAAGEGKLSRKEREDLLDIVGLKDCIDAYPGELSGGEIKRAAIARAVAGNPHTILMDEPTANLDKENVRRVLNLLRKKAAEGNTVIISSHEEDAREYADVTVDLDLAKE